MSNEKNRAGIENITPEFLTLIKLPEKNAKILNYLIVLPVITYNMDLTYGFPVGIAFVSAALKASGRNVHTLNLNYKKNPAEILKRMVADNNIDVVMTGGLGVQFWDVKMIIDTVKEVKPDCITVVGGGIITADPVTAMTALGSADYGVIGEGEVTINALAYALETEAEPASVDGVICFRGGEWSVRENWGSVHDLDILPFPDYEGFEYSQLLGKMIDESVVLGEHRAARHLGSSCLAYISISRSCPCKCTFCFHTCGDKFRQMSMDRTFKLIDWLSSLYPLKGLHMEDELTFSNYKTAVEFCRRVKPYNFTWKCCIRADMVTDGMLLAMKKSGCGFLNLGIESADNRILKSMRKNVVIEQVERVLAYAAEIGLFVGGNLIFGDLEETAETFWNSINWWQAHRDWHIRLLMISVFPGSYLYKYACNKGIIKDPVQYIKDGYPLVNVSKMNDDDYNALQLYTHILALDNKLEAASVEAAKDYTVNVSGCCPYCGKSVTFNNLAYVFSIAPLLCPVCNQEITVNPIEYCDTQRLNTNAENILLDKSAAVWAVNPYNFYWLFKTMPVLKNENVKFINKNDIIIPENGRKVKTLMGKEVFAPEIIRHSGIDTILVPNNPAAYESIKRQCLAEFPNVKRIVHITELL